MYDPIDGNTFLEAYVCDECLLQKKELIEEVVLERTDKVIARRPPSRGLMTVPELWCMGSSWRKRHESSQGNL